MKVEHAAGRITGTRILFLQPSLSHVRYQRRLEKLEELGVTVEIRSFERDIYTGRKIDRDFVSLGHIEHGHYFERISLLLQALFAVRRNLRTFDVVYTFGLDMALLACSARIGIHPRPKLVYEVGDIVEVFLRSGIVARFWRALERLVLDRTDLLVATSEAFIREYFKPIHGHRLPATLVIENKPRLVRRPGSESDQRPDPTTGGCFRIGWFGLLRCTRSMEILSNLVRESDGRFELTLRGLGMAGLDPADWADSSQSISFGGTYVAPNELPEMYAGVDLIWGCFPLLDDDGCERLSGKWARTNRFYEACFFRRPLVSRCDSEDGREVEQHRIGLCVDLRNPAETVERLLSITEEEFAGWRLAIDRLAPSVYSYTDEHERLIRKLR